MLDPSSRQHDGGRRIIHEDESSARRSCSNAAGTIVARESSSLTSPTTTATALCTSQLVSVSRMTAGQHFVTCPGPGDERTSASSASAASPPRS